MTCLKKIIKKSFYFELMIKTLYVTKKFIRTFDR